METPKTRYVTVGDSDVAYQVVGHGPLGLLYCYGLGSHIELLCAMRGVAEFLSNLTAFSRLIIFDQRHRGPSFIVQVVDTKTKTKPYTQNIDTATLSITIE